MIRKTEALLLTSQNFPDKGKVLMLSDIVWFPDVKYEYKQNKQGNSRSADDTLFNGHQRIHKHLHKPSVIRLPFYEGFTPTAHSQCP